MSGELTFVTAPLLPWPLIAALAAAAAIGVGVGWWARARGALWRTLAAVGLVFALVNPVTVIEERRPLTDVALVVVDESPSQGLGERRRRTEAGLQAVETRLAQYKDLEVRTIRAGAPRAGGGGGEGTRLFEAVERALADVPKSRVAGVILLTDGQVHDAPQPGPDGALGEAERERLPGPVHALLTGERSEGDRRLIVERSPTYGIVGKPFAVTLRIDDGPPPGGRDPARQLARVDVRRDGGEPQSFRIPVGESHNIEFTLEHGGTTIFEIAVEAGPRELTLDNNRAVVAVNGVRDRLRVLLVTGEPHPGERTWRNLLKSDPSVDLVHFTILRPPEAQDFTPVNELSLIAFPVRELFEIKLAEFDLVIFDRYRRRDVLAQTYLDNIVRYVRGGGALLVSVGPNFGSSGNLFGSPIGQIMPGVPTGTSFEQGFKPKPTDLGRRHPVTADLPGADAADPPWGRWFRHIDTEPRRGQVLMSGANDRPLLLLDRVGDGRVAQIMSDQIWLWARGYEGGGPQAELLRRIAHWLMKEPELEENDLRATVRGNRIEIERRSLVADGKSIEVTAPSGAKRTVALAEGRGGRSGATIEAEETGLYHLTDGTRIAIAAVGALNPVEFANVRATETLLAPAARATGGQVLWLADGLPDIRRVRPGREAGGREPGGRGWIGLRANGDYVVTGLMQLPLMPGAALFLLTLGALILAWRREGR
ncbi:MAG: hypothetical protein HY057_09745 [Rhodospirillales bacterium]|nr:hypothetical protein [Rhodospirillales bacterium]